MHGIQLNRVWDRQAAEPELGRAVRARTNDPDVIHMAVRADCKENIVILNRVCTAARGRGRDRGWTRRFASTTLPECT